MEQYLSDASTDFESICGESFDDDYLADYQENFDATYDSLSLEIKINMINGLTYQDKLNTLSNCNCCDRHQINKPKIFLYWFELSPSYSNNLNCICDCRHLARFISRQADTSES